MKSVLSRLSFFVGLLVIILSYQNCTNRFAGPIQFSSTQMASGGGGNGDYYDGKPSEGIYVRELPDRPCGSNGKPVGRLTVTADHAELVEIDPIQCSSSTQNLLFSQLEFSDYNSHAIGFGEGVFARLDEKTSVSPKIEAWCRAPQSGVSGGMDVMVVADSKSGDLTSTFFMGGVDGQGQGVASQSPPLSVSRATGDHQIAYTGASFSLAVNVVSSGVKSQARLKGFVDGQTVDTTMDCRLAGSLDPKIMIAPPPSSFFMTGLTSASDTVLDAVLLGTQSPRLNWALLVPAFQYEVTVLKENGQQVVCGPILAGSASSSLDLAGCALANGSTYLARLAARTIFGSILNSIDTPFRFVVTQPYGATPWAIPGKVEIETYDKGGEGVGYHDTTPTDLGGQNPLPDAVDVIAIAGGLAVTSIAQGEWLKYTLNVASDGVYQIELGVDSTAAGSSPIVHIEIDGVDVTGQVRLPITQSPGTFPHILLPDIRLSSGTHVMKLVMDGHDFALSHMIFTLKP